MFRRDPSDDTPAIWKSLRTLCGVRVLAAGAALFLAGSTTARAEASLPVALVYLALTLAGVALSWIQRPRFLEQLTAILVVDLLFVSLLVFNGHGASDGMAMLFFAPVAGAALLAHMPIALLVAATSSLVLLADALLRQLGGLGEAQYSQAGALGAAMFGAAVVLNRLAARVLAQERLVQAKNAELEAQVRVNRAVINEMRQGILIVSQDGQVRAANPAARTVLELDQLGAGGELGERLARQFPTLSRVLSAWARTPPTEPRAWTVLLEPASQTGNPSATEIDVAGRAARRVRIRSIPFGIGKTRDAPLLVSIEDMREVDTQAMQLKLASMGRLTASIAHEIRNPLAAIGHAASLLAEERLDDGLQRLVRIMQDNVSRLDRIVEDVLSVSRSTRVRSETLALATTIGQIVGDFARDRGLDPARFAVDIDERSEIQFDRAHLTQIVVNLVANAARYGSEAPGAIEITADAQSDGTVALTVANDGAPIDPAVRAQLFEPFYTTWRNGTGLGLFLARELAIANASELFLDDAAIVQRRCGAAFTLRIGAAVEASEPLTTEAS